jgi:hypothetical protein
VQADIKVKEALLKIDNKDRRVVPFRHNSVQKEFELNKTRRNIILKARQLGMSSNILADMFIEAITIPNTTCVVVSHETLAAKRLLDRIHFYYNNLDNPKPQMGAGSRTEISFPELHSAIYIGTAGSMTFGRGDRIDHALLSELAFYDDGERIINAVEEAVPLNGTIDIECSPNGEDNIFYLMWVRAREGKNSYHPFFFPWWYGHDYVLPQGHELALPEDRGSLIYTGEEADLRKKFNLSEEQMRWRRYKIANKGGLFYQEYPEDEVSCFITIGDPVFDPYVLNQLAQGCFDGERHPSGWTYWVQPEEGVRYIIGVDSSAGVPDGSYSAAVVLSENWEVCATFQARIEPPMLASIIQDMGKWYNNAEIAVERNFTGYTVLSHLTNYPNIYYQRDFTSGKQTSTPGWWTNAQTKEFMMSTLKDKLQALSLWDVNLVRQARGYRYIKLKPEAQTYDDLIIALMIACSVKEFIGEGRGYVGAALNWDW